MSATVMQGSAERSSLPYELEPAVYIEAVREFLHENGADVMRRPAKEVQAQAEAEEASSKALVAKKYGAPATDPEALTEADWISDGFSTVMVRLVKASAKAADTDPVIRPFGEIDEEAQDRIRQHLFTDYMDLSDLFVGSKGPSKSTYQLSPVLYHSPANVHRLMAENEDLGMFNVVRAIRHQPLGIETFLEQSRVEIQRAIRQFPTIPQSVIRAQIMYSPGNYENSLIRYAERKGLSLESGDQPIPDAKSFLRSLRELVRSRQYDLRHINPPAEQIKVTRRLGKEALAAVEESGTPLRQDTKETFQKRIELLAAAANRAWRHGDLPVTPERAPLEFRRALYAHAFGDFLQMHAEFNGHVETSRLILYYDAAEVQVIVADNPDLPAYALLR